ncbi:ABC transporter substrate-binding protein [Glutamicibacter sp. JC586]|uniref:ABC transporter substrate-binding protein n=1 Tax=Glutamicibacter sp. JC586 TaxID=2590552 RepID=UPI00135BA942|nr:ABC transporter substrate-binding protein [Glutamicibacter sp. JC586]
MERQHKKKSSRTSPKAKLILGAAFLIVIGLVVAGSALFRPSQRQEPISAAPITLALEASRVPKDASIGLVVSYGDSAGSEWKDAANGALVAAKRFELGGTAVSVETRDDRGTDEGAREAVEELKNSNVSGIIIASSGEHVSAALDEAQKSGIPVVLPYYTGSIDQYSDVYRTTASNAAVANKLNHVVQPATNPMLLNAGGQPLDGLTAGQVREVGSSEDLGELAKALKSLAAAERSFPIDAVVINGTARRQAQLVTALQKAKVDLPIALSSEATSPVFATSMVAENASLSNELATVGSQSFDDAALDAGASGQAMNSYLAVLQQMASNEETLSLAGDRPFADVAPVADSRAHDAVVALVRAIEDAHSTQPQKVAKNLRGLSLDTGEGLAHGTLDFDTSEAFTDQPQELRLSNQDLGLRTVNSTDGSAQQWFAVRTDG